MSFTVLLLNPPENASAISTTLALLVTLHVHTNKYATCKTHTQNEKERQIFLLNLYYLQKVNTNILHTLKI
jgi:hypothetical protein